MVGHGLVVGLLAFTPTAPPPKSPAAPPAAPPIASADATAFAGDVIAIARRLRDEHAREPGLPELVAAAVNGLYAAAGAPVPPEVREELARPRSEAAYAELLTRARLSLGDRPSLAGPRAFVATVTALSRAADPYCELSLERRANVASGDPEFGLGFELAGATGPDWLVYYLELRVAVVRRTVRADDPAKLPRPPVPAPWRVKRVIPGGPAAAAGLRAGDQIVACNGRLVTPATTPRLVADLLLLTDPDLGPHTTAPGGEGPKVVFGVRRDGEPGPLEVTIPVVPYDSDSVESVFGFARKADGGWDLFPNPATKIGYLRLGPVEQRAANEFHELLDQLAREGAAGLVLDLRWNPGGYVTPATEITGQFLKPDETVAVIKYRRPERQGPTPHAPPAAGREWAMAVPLAVLVNAETIGGGEMIAAALQDHQRAVVVGQRTAGKATVMSTYDTGIRGLAYRVTVGYSFRPNGKSRQRLPGSGPLDEWGIRPDPGCEVPTTPGYSRRLREWVEWQACRPAGSTAALPLDDPLNDPQRTHAENILLARIRAAKK